MSRAGDGAGGTGELRFQLANLGNDPPRVGAHDVEQGGGQQPPPDQQAEAIRKRNSKLYKAAITGNWRDAERIFNDHREADLANVPITELGETALHIATLAEKTTFVSWLVRRMNEQGLTHQDTQNDTALCLAAITGKTELAVAMLKRMQELPNLENGETLATMRGRDGMLPLHHAVFSGHRKMVEYLYKETKNLLQDERDLRDLLVALINADMFDKALEIMTEDREYLALQKSYGETALDAIARNPDLLSKGCCRSNLFCNHDQQHRARELLQLQRIRELLQRIFPVSSGCNRDQQHRARELLKRIWDRVILLNEKQILKVVGDGWRTIFVAVERGNIEFLRILIRSYPQLVIKTNEEGQTIFHAAVVHRQEEIFSLIHEIGSFKRGVASSIDNEGNHMLHLAAELPTSNRIEVVPGAALQLQRELLWFEEVKKVVGPRLAEERNLTRENPKAPKELFIENHKDLIKKGEKWMRNTANSCIIVAILVATVVFAAAYTLPGGNQSSGFPTFLHEVSFKIFTIADAISLIFSVSSVLTFLSVLTSTYALNDFVWSLPTKLLIGLTTLFISIVAMLMAFGAAFFVYFKQRRLSLYYALPVTVFAFIPVCLFIIFHRRNFFHMIKSTFKCNTHFSPDGGDPLHPAAEVGTPKCFSCFKCCRLC